MPPNFYCEKCDFKCFKQSIYNTHLDTAKHKKHGYILQYPEKKIQLYLSNLGKYPKEENTNVLTVLSHTNIIQDYGDISLYAIKINVILKISIRYAVIIKRV